MFWKKESKKEENKLPDLPGKRLSRLEMPPINPDIPSEPELDEFRPGAQSKPDFNREEDFSPRTKIPELPRFKMNHEPRPEFPKAVPFNSPEFADIKEQEEEIIPPQTLIPRHAEYAQEQSIRQKGPIFIRLDKFKSAKSSLDNIKEKVIEINELLKKIREIRQKEEQELEYWEKEIHDIQNKLNAVTESIFEKVE